MLPGFRFLFGAILLSMSILVFGLGAAALLRAAHEEFASNSSLRAAPVPQFAQQDQAPKDEPGVVETPMLAMLRIEPEPAQQPAAESLLAAATPAEPAAIAAVPDEPEKIAALAPAASAPPEPGKPENPVPETSVQGEAPAAPTPAPAEEAGIAAAEQLLPPAAETVAPEPVIAPSAPDAGIAATKIATLGGPPVAIETPPPAKAAGARPDPDAARKRLEARRAKERRRIALRARQAAAQHKAADPFAQPTITTRSR